ncbi:hypothetical protein [Phenylobacterium sp.]|uniref:hypothetical protein n=1 Tax=Phenylobacterium sp. TaxID=1871053 RepID=UPI0035668442
MSTFDDLERLHLGVERGGKGALALDTVHTQSKAFWIAADLKVDLPLSNPQAIWDARPSR